MSWGFVEAAVKPDMMEPPVWLEIVLTWVVSVVTCDDKAVTCADRAAVTVVAVPDASLAAVPMAPSATLSREHGVSRRAHGLVRGRLLHAVRAVIEPDAEMHRGIGNKNRPGQRRHVWQGGVPQKHREKPPVYRHGNTGIRLAVAVGVGRITPVSLRAVRADERKLELAGSGEGRAADEHPP